MLMTRATRSRWVLPWGTTTVALRARSDDELLLDVGAGDHQAFATLYDHMAGLVYANIRCVLHDTIRTDTVAEETFVEVRRQAARFDPSRTSALIWILDLAHQLATESDQVDDSRPSAGSLADPGGTHPSPPVVLATREGGRAHAFRGPPWRSA